jgi:hypothetical protein
MNIENLTTEQLWSICEILIQFSIEYITPNGMGQYEIMAVGGDKYRLVLLPPYTLHIYEVDFYDDQEGMLDIFCDLYDAKRIVEVLNKK